MTLPPVAQTCSCLNVAVSHVTRRPEITHGSDDDGWRTDYLEQRVSFAHDTLTKCRSVKFLRAGLACVLLSNQVDYGHVTVVL